MFCLWKNFDQIFFQFFLTPSKCSTKNWTWFFPYFSFEKFSFFWQNFFSAKSLFFLCFPFKFFFRPTKKNNFFTLQMQIFTIFCLIIFLPKIFFLKIFADRPPKKCSTNALHPPNVVIQKSKYFTSIFGVKYEFFVNTGSRRLLPYYPIYWVQKNCVSHAAKSKIFPKDEFRGRMWGAGSSFRVIYQNCSFL